MPTQTKSSLFGSIFTTLIIDFRWWKSPPGYAAIFRRFSSAILRDAPFKPLLQFFAFVCHLKTNSSLFESVFNTLRNNFRILKSRRGLWARDFTPFFQRVAATHTFKSLLPFFKFMYRLKINLTVFGSVFTDLRNKFRWLRSPPGHPSGLARTPGKSL